MDACSPRLPLHPVIAFLPSSLSLISLSHSRLGVAKSKNESWKGKKENIQINSCRHVGVWMCVCLMLDYMRVKRVSYRGVEKAGAERLDVTF